MTSSKPQAPAPADFDAEVYAAYAAGKLDAGFRLLIDTRAALKTDAAVDVTTADVVGGALLELEPPVALSSKAFVRLMAAIEEAGPMRAPEPRAAMMAGSGIEELVRLPAALRDRALEAAGRHGWKSAGRGLKILRLDAGGEAEIELMRMEPGARAPRHSHRGLEYTLVVSGGFSDERASYGPGDLSVNGPEDTHKPVADDDGVCLALAVRDGGLQFTGMLGMMQKLLGK